MAHYIFVKTRKATDSSDMFQKLQQACNLLTPEVIKEKSQETIEAWSKDSSAFYAIQNSESVAKPKQDALIIGWLQQSFQNKSEIYTSEADGSYAIIKNDENGISFFSDQFGSRALWYYFDESILIVSTSQRAIVALKGTFQFNEEALAWYLSSGCQGPFISWDQDIKQVLPNLEYSLNIADWHLKSKQKPGMDLPLSGSTKMNDYLQRYQSQVTDSLDQIINEYPKEQVLMPLSGGLDSRSLLAISKNAGLLNKVTLVNWGEMGQEGVFDDKTAAKKVASFYGEELLDIILPIKIDNYDQVFDRYVEECEGRIDHLSAFTDAFKMWEDLFMKGYRMIVRGDIPVTEGLDLTEVQVRQRMGLNLFGDYANVSKYPVRKYMNLQKDYGSKRLSGESFIRWRDRLFLSFTMPMQVSAYTQQISAFSENRAPMLNWSLFKLYMGLPDSEKGNKLHMQKLWEKNDKTGISRYAVRSLRGLGDIIDNEQCNQYLINKLVSYEKQSLFTLELITTVRKDLAKQEYSSENLKSKPFFLASYEFLTNNMPLLLKAYIRSNRPTNLPNNIIACRMVLAEKIVTMYETDAKKIKVST